MQADSGFLSSRRRQTIDLGLIFAVALGARLLFAALNPPWLIPDETAHFTYVSYLVEAGKVPNWNAPDDGPTESTELRESCRETHCWGISGLGGPGRSLASLPLEQDYTRARALRLPPAERRSSAGSSASSYPPFYYLLVSPVYRALYEAPILTRLLALRVLSSALTALVAVFGYLMTRELSGSAAWGRSVGLSLALMPMHAFIGSGVNNDAAMFATTAALCWLMAIVWRRREVTPAFCIVSGVIAGCALLAKPTSAPIVVAMFLSLAATCLGPWQTPWRLDWAALKGLAAYAASVALLQGSWMAYRRAYLSAVTIKPPVRVGALGILAGEAPFSFGDYLRYLHDGGAQLFEWMFVRSFWGVYGWLELHLSDLTYKRLEWILGAAALGLVLSFWHRSNLRWITLGLSVLVVANAVLLILAADFFISFANTGTTFGIQGRYFFGTLPAYFFLFTRGLHFLGGGSRLALLVPPLVALWLYATSMLTVMLGYYGVKL